MLVDLQNRFIRSSSGPTSIKQQYSSPSPKTPWTVNIYTIGIIYIF